MSRYQPKPGPAAPFAIVLARYGGLAEVVAALDPPETAEIAANEVKQSRPKLAACTFTVDRIEKDGGMRS